MHVVVLRGKCTRMVGVRMGPDRSAHTPRPRSWVHFAGESFPREFCSIADSNWRAATRGEILAARVKS